MYIALETFTSQHKRHYQRDEEINSFVYFTLTDGDKKKFKKKVEEVYPTNTFMNEQTEITVYEESMPVNPDSFSLVDDLVNQPPSLNDSNEQFQGFGGGSGGGGGAGGNWNDDNSAIDNSALDDQDNSYDSGNDDYGSSGSDNNDY